MILIYIVFFFYGGYAIGRVSVKSSHSRLPFAGLAVFLSTIGLFFLVAFLIRGPGAGLGMAGFIIGIFLPLGLASSGFGIGALSKVYTLRGNSAAAILLFWGPSVLYLVVFLCGLYFSYQAMKTEEISKNHYQSLTLGEVLGPYKITFPISPQIDVNHHCHFESQAGAPLKACYAREYSLDYRLQSAREREAAAPYLKRLTVRANSADCKSYTLNSSGCADLETLTAWCAQRPELAGSVWCERTVLYKFTFEEYFEPNAFSKNLDAKNWVDAGVKLAIEDFRGMAVTPSCSAIRDSLIADSQGYKSRLGGLGRLCRVRYRLNENVIVEGKFDAFNDTQIGEAARHTHVNIAAFWADMTARAAPN